MKKTTMPKQAKMTAQEEQMERVVKLARTKLLPYFENKDFTLEFTEWLCENTAVIINGGAYDLMKKHTVADLRLDRQVKKEYPNYKNFLEFIKLIQDMPMSDAINSLQWLSQKVQKTVKDENGKRKFKSLMLDF